MLRLFSIFLLMTIWVTPVSANSGAVNILTNYYVMSNQTYLLADGLEQKLDVYVAKDAHTKARPTLVYIHGGGWMGGSKEADSLHLLPYLEAGFNAVNVDYRLGGTALAPAAIEDVRCALRWVFQNSTQFGIDTNKIVLSGNSAGGHLALMAGMLPASAGFDKRCPTGNEKTSWPNDGKAKEVDMPVAAIVNWYGITDVNDLIQGENAMEYAVKWLGGQRDEAVVAKRASPLTYVRKDLPPILTIHGDSDIIVPYKHAVRLHNALEKESVKNTLFAVEGGGHGQFSQDQNQQVFREIWRFLHAHIDL